MRFINEWRAGSSIHQFALFSVWYVDKSVFGHVQFGFLVLNFGVCVG